MGMTKAGSDCIPRAPKTGSAPALSALVVVAVVGGAALQPAHAGECSTDQAEEIAVERYGGEALSVSPDGDHLIVRLQLSDGRVIDVAVDRWGCSE